MTSKCLLLPHKHYQTSDRNDKPMYYKCRKYQLSKHQTGKQYRYVQPEIPKPFRPAQEYRKPTNILDSNTVHKLSYVPVSLNDKPEIVIPPTNLRTSNMPMNSDTIHKLSYQKWLNVEKVEPIKPMVRNLNGVGKFTSDTVYKTSYPWTQIDIPRTIRPQSELCISSGPVDANTVHKLTFMPYKLSDIERIKQVRHKNELRLPIAKMENCTVNKLSYVPHHGDFRREPCGPTKDHPILANYNLGTNRMKSVCSESYQLPGYFQEVPSDEHCCCMCYCEPISRSKMNNTDYLYS